MAASTRPSRPGCMPGTASTATCAWAARSSIPHNCWWPGGWTRSCPTALQALSYAGEKLPFLCVAALMQKDPQGLMVHAGQGDDSFEALRGRPIMVGAGGRIGFWPWLRATFGYTDEQIRPYTFSVAPFLHDPRAVQQAFVTAEPFTARGAGAQTGFLLFADRGFDNYQTTIDTSAKTVANRGEVLQRFVDATIEGWALYMRGTDRAAAHALIQRDNPDMPAEALAYADTAMAERGIVESGDAVTLGIGAMTQARWTRFGADMVRAGLFPAGLDVARAYSLQFVNRKIGL